MSSQMSIRLSVLELDLFFEPQCPKSPKIRPFSSQQDISEDDLNLPQILLSNKVPNLTEAKTGNKHHRDGKIKKPLLSFLQEKKWQKKTCFS